MAEPRNTLTKSAQFVARWLKRIGLDRTWQVILEEKRIRGRNAEITWVDHRATMTINPDAMAEMGKEEWEQILLHEVCHLLLAELENWAEEEFDIAGRLGESYRRHSEVCVDRVANVLQNLHP